MPDGFLPGYNRRFAQPAREAGNDFRPLSRKLNWDRWFSLRYERVVGKDHVVSFRSRTIQLPPARVKKKPRIYLFAGHPAVAFRTFHGCVISTDS